MGYCQQVCSIFKFESFNTAHQKKAFQSIINEKKDVFVYPRLAFLHVACVAGGIRGHERMGSLKYRLPKNDTF
jgi:hypothetical protein